MRRFLLPTAAPLLMLLLFASRGIAATPAEVWVGTAPVGSTIQDAWDAGAEVLDRAPGLFIVRDQASANALETAGFPVEGPIGLAPGRTVYLVNSKADITIDRIDRNELTESGIDILWEGATALLLESDDFLPVLGTLNLFPRKVLRERLVQRPRVIDRIVAKTQATTFQPIIQEMVDQVDSATFMQWIGNLAGDNGPIMVSGNPVQINTRYTPTAQCDTSERYIYEQFLAMGFTDVELDPFTFSSTTGRNIIATLPGTVTPEKIIIVGGHMDATSPQASSNAPGANDNGSGTAGVLTVAEILKDYTFKSTIKFIAFSGEEQGLVGSAHYASQAASAGDQIEAMVNLDMIAYWNNNYEVIIEGTIAFSWLMDIYDDACSEYTSLLTDPSTSSSGSDHVPFQNEGFPAFLAIEKEWNSYPCYHQTCDTTDNNDGDFGVEITRAALATVAHLAEPLGLTIAHTPLISTTDQVGPYDVVATIASVDPLITDSLLVHYSTGGPFSTLIMTPTANPDEFTAPIPGQPANTTISYYIAAADSAARHATHPLDAPASLNEFLIGSLQVIFFEDFESGAPGWAHGGTGDEWELGSPLALADDPSSAFSGSNVYGLDLTGLGSDPGKYENFSDTWLVSLPMDLTDFSSVSLSFKRWLAVERSNGGAWDYARVYVNDTQLWESPAGANLVDNQWVNQVFDISAVADGNPYVQISFTLKSDVSFTFGGWNLDDITIIGIGPGVPTDVSDQGIVPATLALHGNQPNPFNPTTRIRYELPSRSAVSLAVFDISGRLVRTLVSEVLNAGSHEVLWDGRNNTDQPASSGIYFYRLDHETDSRTRRMVLIR